jgi:hypothetical protein
LGWREGHHERVLLHWGCFLNSLLLNNLLLNSLLLNSSLLNRQPPQQAASSTCSLLNRQPPQQAASSTGSLLNRLWFLISQKNFRKRTVVVKTPSSKSDLEKWINIPSNTAGVVYDSFKWFQAGGLELKICVQISDDVYESLRSSKTQKKGEEELMVVSSIKSFDNGHEESIHGGIRLSLAPHPCR